jgi:hypothetical protein
VPIISGGGGNGGSLPSLSLIDGGTHTIAALLDSPATIYTPTAGEEVWVVLISAFATVDGTYKIGVTTADLDATTRKWLTLVGGAANQVEDSVGSVVSGDVPDGSFRLYPATDPVLVGIRMPSTSSLLTPGGAWQPATTYENDVISSRIVMSGHIWVDDGAASGVSGNVQPDFAGNIGGSVSDGPDVDWADQGAVPTTGSVTLRLIVGTPT